MHTGFHRFTEISQIFHNKYIQERTCKVQGFIRGEWKWPISFPNDSETQERRLKEVIIENISRGEGGRMPPDPTRSLRLRRSCRKSVSIHPRSAPGYKNSQIVLKSSFCGPHSQHICEIFRFVSSVNN